MKMFTLLCDFDGEQQRTNRYFHGPGIDEILAISTQPNTELWVLTDHLGTVRVSMDQSTDEQVNVAYDSFGIPISIGDIDQNAIIFAGREFDVVAESYYFRGRWMDPATGRFLSVDRIGYLGGDANLYRYVANSPLNAVDPYGNMARTVKRQNKQG